MAIQPLRREPADRNPSKSLLRAGWIATAFGLATTLSLTVELSSEPYAVALGLPAGLLGRRCACIISGSRREARQAMATAAGMVLPVL